MKIFRFETSIYFANAEHFRDRLYKKTGLKPRKLMKKKHSAMHETLKRRRQELEQIDLERKRKAVSYIQSVFRSFAEYQGFVFRFNFSKLSTFFELHDLTPFKYTHVCFSFRNAAEIVCFLYAYMLQTRLQVPIEIIRRLIH